MKVIDVLIVDDSELYHIGVKTMLKEAEGKINILGEVYNCTDAVQFLKNKLVDIILLDISLEEEMDGIDLAFEIKNEYPKIKIIILSHYKDPQYIINALRAHVNAYLAKDSCAEELINTIISIQKGNGLYLGETLSNQAINVLVEKYFGNERNIPLNKPHDLTNREIEIIKLLSEGLSSKQIAERLFIAKTTVESHKESIKNKLQLKTTIEVVIFAVKNQVIKIE